ncbi:hydrogenase maturation protease [bacterium]|nr:hydrogenase maturation protease [bacterium]
MNLIIGIGNILLSDEGIGIHVLKELKKRNKILNTEFVDLGTSSLDLEYFIHEDTESMAVIDCLNTKKDKPGTIYKISVDDLKSKRNCEYSLHQLEFIDSINIILLLSKIPKTIIFGIEPFDMKTLSLNLSEPLREKFEAITKKIEKEIVAFFK